MKNKLIYDLKIDISIIFLTSMAIIQLLKVIFIFNLFTIYLVFIKSYLCGSNRQKIWQIISLMTLIFCS